MKHIRKAAAWTPWTGLGGCVVVTLARVPEVARGRLGTTHRLVCLSVVAMLSVSRHGASLFKDNPVS